MARFNSKDFGATIRNARKSKGLSQKNLANIGYNNSNCVFISSFCDLFNFIYLYSTFFDLFQFSAVHNP